MRVIGPSPARARPFGEHGARSWRFSGGSAGASGALQPALGHATPEELQAQGGRGQLAVVDLETAPQLGKIIARERRSGVTFTALGFGTGNLADSMLEAISNAGNGFYGVISSEEQAASYVSERLLSTLSLIAKDVKIQVELNPERVFAYRLLGYENRDVADANFRNDSVDAGEIGAGHRVTALYELVLSGAAVPVAPGAPELQDGAAFDGTRAVAPEDLVLVKVRYKNADATEDDPAHEVATSLTARAVSQSLQDADLRWAAAIAGFAELLKRSPYANPGALATLEDVFAAQSGRDADRGRFVSLFERVRPQL